MLVLVSADSSPEPARRIAYLQPATRAEISRLAGREISRDVISRLKRLDLVDAGLRAPEPGAPFAYVTTRKFLQVLGLASLRDLPDIERLEDEGLLNRPPPEADLDSFFGIDEDDFDPLDEAEDDWQQLKEHAGDI